MTVLCAVVAAVCVLVVLQRLAVWPWLRALAALPFVSVAVLGHVEVGSAVLAVLVSAALGVANWRATPPRPVWLFAAVLVVAGVVAFHVLDDSPWHLDFGGWLGVVPAAVGLAAAVGIGRARHSGLELPCATLAVVPGVVLLADSADAITTVAWWPAAGALGVTALLRGRRGARRRPECDPVDAETLRTLPATRLAPVAIVIAAYNEADGLPTVLQALPHNVCGHATDVVVVDDGSTDGTADAARATGRALVAACPTNRGQGAALRLGYLVARTHGAAYVVTTDADGQYDVADMPAVLGPILDGRADFVTGSRRLGALHNRDRVRQLGTYVFAWLASALVGQWLTDTSFGLRAMRAEVTAAVTLDQPQYQASELLLGVASHGFRILEVPGTMHRRSAGASKKGGNLLYGRRYAKVMLGTWLREGAPRPVTEVAPALQASGRAKEGSRGRPGP